MLFVPTARLFVAVAASGDKLNVYRVDLEAEMDKLHRVSVCDVAASLKRSAASLFQYAIQVRSKKAASGCKLESARTA